MEAVDTSISLEVAKEEGLVWRLEPCAHGRRPVCLPDVQQLVSALVRVDDARPLPARIIMVLYTVQCTSTSTPRGYWRGMTRTESPRDARLTRASARRPARRPP